MDRSVQRKIIVSWSPKTILLKENSTRKIIVSWFPEIILLKENSTRKKTTN
jgi:hypothetical protein